MSIINDQPRFDAAVEKKVAGDQAELVLDSGFVVPDSNAFGQTFRNYEADSERKHMVEEFYRTNHLKQPYEFMKQTREGYARLDKTEMGIWECMELLNEVVDDSDPDLDLPQIQHLLQTAEAIRKDYPDEDLLHLTGFIHAMSVSRSQLHHKESKCLTWTCCKAQEDQPLAMTDELASTGTL